MVNIQFNIPKNFSRPKGSSQKLRKIDKNELIIFSKRIINFCRMGGGGGVGEIIAEMIKHNQLTSGELLSNDRRAVGFVNT